LWSLAVNPSLASCVRELRRLYDRAFHRPAFLVGLATGLDCAELFPGCDRSLLLTNDATALNVGTPRAGTPVKSLPLFQRDSWDEVLKAIRSSPS
jgi:hypothetical protein